jgi:hypothetical protein
MSNISSTLAGSPSPSPDPEAENASADGKGDGHFVQKIPSARDVTPRRAVAERIGQPFPPFDHGAISTSLQDIDREFDKAGERE